MENPRTTSARDHDDHDLIEGIDASPSASGSSGGNLARDIASADEEASLIDPEGHQRVRKEAAISHRTARRTTRRR